MSELHFDDQLIKWAHSAWDRLDLTPPCNLAVVSEFLKLQVVRDTLAPGMFGVYCRLENGESIAFIEAAMPAQRQAWVWAHEIGHHLLSKKTLGILEIQCSAANHNDPLERDCDRFAKHLLMPEVYLRQSAAALGHPKTNRTSTLAAKFGVDKETMANRLTELGIGHAKHRRPAVTWAEMQRRMDQYRRELVQD